jgi:hypothetical protein
MSPDSNSASPPGQKSSEVPHSIKYDDFVSTIWAVFMLLFPPMWIDDDKLLHKRLWAWRYIYLSFVLISAIFFHQSLLAGNLSAALLFPFAHLVAPLSVGGLVADISIGGFGLPLVSYSTAIILYNVAIGAVFGGEILRRTSPAMFARNPWGHEEGEAVVPLEEVANKDDDADTPPTLDQDVSTAVIGETGSGKTSMMQLLAYQFPYDRDTAVIAHDPGEEFQKFYTDLGFDVKRISASDSDVVWNLFEDADSEADFREVAGAIFGEPNGHNPFHRPAKQTFLDMLLYLHREAKRNSRRDALCHADIVDLLQQGRAALKQALDEYDRLDSGHIDLDKGKGAQNVYQTLRENVRPVFVDDFGDFGQFSLQEYIENPDGRVLIIDSSPSRMETLGPMYQLLLDWSIRYAMEAPNPTVHVLDEIDALPALSQVSNLTARGRKHKARALVGVQTIGQLDDTYSTISGILGNCPQGVYFGPGDHESTDFVLNELGERRQLDRTEMVAMTRQGRDKPARAQSRDTYKKKDKTPVTSGMLRDFEPGECIVVSRTTWWHGHSYELHEVREDLPEMGAESAETPRLDDDDNAEDLEEHESWRSLIETKVDALTSETTVDGETADDTIDEPDESPNDTGDDPVPDVWALKEDVTPSRSYTESFWTKSLDRLDVQELPITEKQNVDALRDLSAMLDDRVLSMPDNMVVTEIRECLADITAQTGLSPEDTLEVALEHTDALAMNETFQEKFVTEWTHSVHATQASTDDPLAQTTENTAIGSPLEDANMDDTDEEQQADTTADEPPSQSADSVDKQQYTLDGITDALPDETTDEEAADMDNESQDIVDETTQNSESETTNESDSDTDDSVDYGRFM